MRTLTRIVMLLAVLTPLLVVGDWDPRAATAELRVTDAVLHRDLPRYGLNLGGSGSWGAEQLRANVLANPGFEAILDRTLIVLKEASGHRVVDDTDWLARPDGFWAGARFEVRTGSASGRAGTVRASRKRSSDGLAEFELDSAIPELAPGDVISLAIEADPRPAPLWWLGGGRIAAVNTDTRPGSPGRQSVNLSATPDQPAELIYYLDNLPERAGKLLPVEGSWRLSLWLRARSSSGKVKIYFGRLGAPPFLAQDLQVDQQWRKHEVEFSARDDAPPGALTFSIKATDGDVLVDDVSLGEAGAEAGGFRRAVVETLMALRPGYLRDWQGQLGETLDNRLADAYGRQPSRYRPGDSEAMFHYSLPEFLALCAAVGARPWVVAPTTLGDAEWRRLGEYLKQSADRHRFPQILVEFGNENWNLLFRPAGITDAARHAAAADRAFRLIRAGAAGDDRITTVVNAQFVNPDSPRRIGAMSREADRVSVAPYFLYSLDASQSPAAAREAAFGEDAQLIDEEARTAVRQNKRLAFYEVNFHTTLGSASSAQRNDVVAGAGSGAALARRLVGGTLAGVSEQAVYVLAGYDNYVQGSRDLVRLWGITRDLGRPGNLRPTGLGLQLLNRVAGGEARAVSCRGSACGKVTAVAFGGGQSLAVVSALARAAEIDASVSCSGASAKLAVLDGSRPELNNENGPQVGIKESEQPCQNGRVRFTLPAYSLAVIAQ